MPSRVIRGELCSSDSLSRVSVGAAHLFTLLILTADDFGRFDGRPRIVLRACFPLRDDVSQQLVEQWLTELANADGKSGPIVRYEVDGRPFLQLSNWERHRGHGRRAAHSKFPKQPTSSDIPGNPRKPSGILGTTRTSAGILPGDGGRGTRDEGREAKDEKNKNQLAALAGAAAPLDPDRLVNLLAQESGTRDEHLAWLLRELPVIELLADEDHPADPKRRMAAVRSRVLRHWRQHQKPNGKAMEAEAVKRADRARADRIARETELRRLYTDGRLQSPTEDAWRKWQGSGAPDRPCWWDPEGAYRPSATAPS